MGSTSRKTLALRTTLSYTFSMKFVTAIAGVIASSALAQAKDTRYALLQKEYEALAPRLEEMGFGEIGSFGLGNLGPITGLNKLDTNALRRAGRNDIADSLDSLGEKSLAAGYKGLDALKALADGDFAKASSMATRPTTCSLTHRPLDSSQNSDLETPNSRLNQLRLSPALWSGPSSKLPRTPTTTLGIRATPDPLTPPHTWCHQHKSMLLTTEGNILKSHLLNTI